MFRVLSVPIIRSTIKTEDAIIGTVHVSMWLMIHFIQSTYPNDEITSIDQVQVDGRITKKNCSLGTVTARMIFSDRNEYFRGHSFTNVNYYCLYGPAL
jgi:hypothetical protein